MRRSGVVVAPYVVRQRQIAVAGRAGDADGTAAIPILRSAVRLGDLRTRSCRRAAVQQSPRRPVAHTIFVVAPPQRPVGAGLVKLCDVSRLGESNIESPHHAGDACVQSIPDDAALDVLVEA